jgi:deoxyribodipyrimidine photolyase
MVSPDPVILWFRQDPRLADNPAIAHNGTVLDRSCLVRCADCGLEEEARRGMPR